jgi:hypothetical protein
MEKRKNGKTEKRKNGKNGKKTTVKTKINEADTGKTENAP